jgi:cyclopropane fatty-acyl-phospholipid synthase-like methyltransferase
MILHKDDLVLLKKLIHSKYKNFESFSYWNDETIDSVDIKLKNVLDIGCGDGVRTVYYAIKYIPKKIVAVDNWVGCGSEINGKNKFEKLISGSGLKNIEIKQADVLKIEFEEQFDTIICGQVLHHLFESQLSILKNEKLKNDCVCFFKKVFGWLKPCGCLIIDEV